MPRQAMIPEPDMRVRAAWPGLLLLAAVVFALLGTGPGTWVRAGADTRASLDDAHSELASARNRSQVLEVRLSELEAELAQAEVHLAEVAARGVDLGTSLVATEAEIREYVVSSYIGGGDLPLLTRLSDTADMAELSWRHEILTSAAQKTRGDVVRLEAMRETAGEEQVLAAERVRVLEADVEDARNDLIQASAHQREAEDALEAARREARLEEAQQRSEAQARARATSTPSAPMPAPGATGMAGDPTPQELAALSRIRRCESRGNYSVVSASGKYRGAYQFDHRTWAGVGGAGDPAAAPPAEQDYRALLLYRARGGRPWPNCS